MTGIWRTCARLVAVAIAAVLIGKAAARPASPGQADMRVPAATTPAGTLLKYDRLQLPAFYRAKAWRIVYVTRDYRLQPILSTGVVVLPDKAPRLQMERRFVAWAHPTTGVARKCAPSLRASPVKAIAGLNDFVAAGVVVVATDYPGLGTAGPVGYLVGKGQAYAVLDSVRAARQIPGVGGGPDFVLWGYSQGGHAALFAAANARVYAPELDLKGVAAVAPPTDLAALLRANAGTVAGRILAAFTLTSWNLKYGVPLDAVVHTGVVPVLSEVSRSCIDDLGSKLEAFAAQKELGRQFFRGDPAANPRWGGLIVQNSLFGNSGRIPTLIVQGDADDIVRPAVTTQFVRASCRSGVPVEYVTLPARGHGGALEAGLRPAVSWLVARLRNAPILSNCR